MSNHTSHKSSLATLTLGALGVVFGDIGTSPLYAFKEAFAGAHPLALTEAHVLAVLSMMFWTVTLIVSLKYISIVLRFDNRGEGGILALLAFSTNQLQTHPRLAWLAHPHHFLSVQFLIWGRARIEEAQAARL